MKGKAKLSTFVQAFLRSQRPGLGDDNAGGSFRGQRAIAGHQKPLQAFREAKPHAGVRMKHFPGLRGRIRHPFGSSLGF